MRKITYRLTPSRFLSLTAAGVAGTLFLTALTTLDNSKAAAGRPSIFSAGLCFAAEGEKLSASEVSAKKTAIEKDIAKAFKLLAQTKLQETRDALAAIELSLGEIQPNLTKQEGTPITLRIDRIKTSLSQKEDSLVNKNLEVLHTKGSDAALTFMQDVSWKHGVSREKLDMIENTILGEAPAVDQAQESQVIDRTVKQIENKQPTDQNVDPYILKTARMIAQAHEDSMARAQQAAAPAPAPETTQPEVPAIAEKPAPAPVAAPQRPAAKPAEEPVVPTETPLAVAAAPAPVVEQQKNEPVSKQETQVAMATPASKPAWPPANPTSPTPLPIQQTTTQKPEEYTSPAIEARIKANQDFLKQYKAEKEKAQDIVVELYNLIESGQNPEAFKKFREKREYLAKYVSTQVFNVLELTLAQNAIDAQKAGNPAAVSSPLAAKSASSGQDIVKRIDGLMRENKVEAAYAEFKRSEPRLKDSMSKNEFKQLKEEVESSYKLRHGETKQK